MPKLEGVLRQLNGEPSEKVLVDTLFQGLFKATTENAQKLSGDVSGSIQEAKRATEIGFKGLSADMRAEIAKIPAPVLQAIAVAHRELSARIDRLEKLLAQSGPERDSVVGNLDRKLDKSVQALIARIDSLPKSIPVPERVNLDPVIDGLLTLSNRKVDLSKIEAKLDRPKKWRLTPKYKDFGNEIDEVIAEEM